MLTGFGKARCTLTCAPEIDQDIGHAPNAEVSLMLVMIQVPLLLDISYKAVPNLQATSSSSLKQSTQSVAKQKQCNIEQQST